MSPLIQAAEFLHTPLDLLRFAITRFETAGLFFGHGWATARDEASYLIAHSLRLPLDQFDDFLNARLLPAERKACLTLLQRRVSERMPAAYLTGEAWLAGHRFRVDQRVIIPRSFIAEFLEGALEPWIEDMEAEIAVLDLCTGSGCLAILTAEAYPAAHVDAADLSHGALAVARQNVEAYGLTDRINVVHTDRFSALGGRRYDLILCNPPYVTTESMRQLPAEYRHEPAMALAAGPQGLDFIDGLLHEAAGHLTDDGILVVEVGNNRDIVERTYPELEALWLESSAAFDPVFLVTRDQLVARFGASL